MTPTIFRRCQPLAMLAIIIVGCLIIGDTLSIKLMQFGPFILPGGAFIYPFAFMATAMIAEMYDFPMARFVVYAALTMVQICAIAIWLTDALVGAPAYHHQAAFHATIGTVPGVMVILVFSQVMGDLGNAALIAHTRAFYAGRYQIARLAIVPLISLELVLVAYLLIYWLPVLSTHDFLVLAGSRLLFAALYHLIVAVPMGVYATRFLQRHYLSDVAL